MVNEKKLKMMTRMALYEKKDGRTMIRTADWTKRKFVFLGVLKTYATTTVAFLIACFLYVLCTSDPIARLEDFLNGFDPSMIGRAPWVSYVLLVLGFSVLAVVLYGRKYDRTRGELKQYLSRQYKLDRFYHDRKRPH